MTKDGQYAPGGGTTATCVSTMYLRLTRFTENGPRRSVNPHEDHLCFTSRRSQSSTIQPKFLSDPGDVIACPAIDLCGRQSLRRVVVLNKRHRRLLMLRRHKRFNTRLLD